MCNQHDFAVDRQHTITWLSLLLLFCHFSIAPGSILANTVYHIQCGSINIYFDRTCWACIHLHMFLQWPVLALQRLTLGSSQILVLGMSMQSLIMAFISTITLIVMRYNVDYGHFLPVFWVNQWTLTQYTFRNENRFLEIKKENDKKNNRFF